MRTLPVELVGTTRRRAVRGGTALSGEVDTSYLQGGSKRGALPSVRSAMKATGRGLHSSTSLLKLSRFCDRNQASTPTHGTKSAHVELKSGRVYSPADGVPLQVPVEGAVDGGGGGGGCRGVRDGGGDQGRAALAAGE